jgi:hypothetical protein
MRTNFELFFCWCRLFLSTLHDVTIICLLFLISNGIWKLLGSSRRSRIFSGIPRNHRKVFISNFGNFLKQSNHRQSYCQRQKIQIPKSTSKNRYDLSTERRRFFHINQGYVIPIPRKSIALILSFPTVLLKNLVLDLYSTSSNFFRQSW